MLRVSFRGASEQDRHERLSGSNSSDFDWTDLYNTAPAFRWAVNVGSLHEKSVPASNRMSPQLEVRRLLWLDPRKLDHLSPLCDLVIDEFAELSRRDRHRLSAHEGKARRHTGIGEDGVDLFVELFDDVARGIPGGTDPVPNVGFIAGHKLGNSGNIWQCIRTGRAGHGQSAHLPIFDVFDALSYRTEHDLHLSGQQIGHIGASIRNVYQLDVGHGIKEFAHDVSRSACARGGHAQHAWIGFGVGYELGKGFSCE